MKQAFGVYNGYAPASGPKAIPLTFDFAVQTSFNVDLQLEETGGVIEYVQGIYVDNSLNGQSVTLVFAITNQKLVVPAGAQGLWPVIAPDQTQFTITSTGGVKVSVLLLNVPTAYTAWGPITVNTVTTLVPTTGSYTNRSGVIAAAGVSQQAMAVNALRKRFMIQNPGSAVESLFINFTDAASPAGDSLELLPGGSYDSAFGPVTTEAINVVAATLGHKFIAKEM